MSTLGFKQSLQKVLPTWNGKALAHVMGWFGEGDPVKVHRVSRYVSNVPSVIASQLNMMQECGIDGIIVTWQGPTVNAFLHDATIKLWEGCMERQMLFALLLDPWIAKQQTNPTQAVITALESVDCQRMLNSPAYLPEGFVIEFDLANSAGVNVANVQSAVSSTPLLSWHTGFSWPNLSPDPAEPTSSISTLKSDNANPAMKIAGVNVMFNDGGSPLPIGAVASNFLGQRNYAQSVWGPGVGATRVIDHQGGNWFYDQLAVTPTYNTLHRFGHME